MNDTEILTLRQLSRYFGKQAAVDSVSEAFRQGEYFCILGPSGCGKSTLLRMVAGFEKADEGSITLKGTDITHLPPQAREVNMVFQNYALFPHLTVGENVAFGLEMRGVGRAERHKEALRMLDMVGLTGLEKRFPKQLSGGQQQRVALARAIINKPALLLLDEPLAALDKHLREQMQRELKKLQQETGITFLHVTHDQDEALFLADRIGIMQGGRFLQAGTAEELYKQPRSRFVATFLGDSNLFDAKIAQPGYLNVGETGHMQLQYAPNGFTPSPESTCTALIRPEHVTILPEPAAGGVNILQGELRQQRYLGAKTAYEVAVNGHLFRVAAQGLPVSGLAEGPVYLHISPEHITLIPEPYAD